MPVLKETLLSVYCEACALVSGFYVLELVLSNPFFW